MFAVAQKAHNPVYVIDSVDFSGPKNTQPIICYLVDFDFFDPKTPKQIDVRELFDFYGPETHQGSQGLKSKTNSRTWEVLYIPSAWANRIVRQVLGLTVFNK